MVQINTKSKNGRTICRGDNKASGGGTPAKPSPLKKAGGKVQAKGAVAWEWWEKEEMTWKPYVLKDAQALEAAFAAGTKIFVTKKLTWNEGSPLPAIAL